MREGPPVFRPIINAGTTVKPTVNKGPRTVATTKNLVRTRWMYSRLTTAKNFFMQIPSCRFLDPRYKDVVQRGLNQFEFSDLHVGVDQSLEQDLRTCICRQ